MSIVTDATLYLCKGGVLSLVTAYRTLSAGLALAQLGMTRLNVLSALSAARMGVVTAAQWALNIAMTANPGLAERGPVLPAGIQIELPELNHTPVNDATIRLWG